MICLQNKCRKSKALVHLRLLCADCAVYSAFKLNVGLQTIFQVCLKAASVNPMVKFSFIEIPDSPCLGFRFFLFSSPIPHSRIPGFQDSRIPGF